jgi:gliding motility-associated-like protein
MKIFYFFLGCLLCLSSVHSFCQENCVNGKDDDSDGLIDLKDPNCQCRYTVKDNLLQNGSFESFLHCPGYTYDNDFNVIDYWRFGTYTNMSEANYYHNFTCPADVNLLMRYIPPALPLPQGAGFVAIQQSVYRKTGFKETDIAKTYITQCLQKGLKAGEQYTLSFSAGRFQSQDDPDFKFRTEPFTVAIFGHSDCNAVPFGEKNVKSNGCPSNYNGWILLGAATVRSKGNWVQNRISFSAPPGINVVAIGPDCSLLNPETELPDSTTRSDYYMYYLDDLHLLPAKEYPFSYIETPGGDPCMLDSLLTAPVLVNATYQWYKDSIAIIGATQKNYYVPKNAPGYYNVRLKNTDTCFVSEPLFVDLNSVSELSLPADTAFCKGETLILMPSGNNVTYNWNGSFGAEVKISKPGIYEIKAINTNGCTKTFTVNVHEVDCSNNAAVQMPNAFTPNGDGKNDVFRIPANSLISLNEFAVYDRWGKKIFSTKNKSRGWNGNDGDKINPPGTYVYFIKGAVNNKMIEVKGTVTLIR